MIWKSVFLMTIIDMIVLFLTFLALWDFYQNRILLKRLRVFSGLALVVGGLFIIGSLYIIDLLAMHLFPMMMPMGKAMKFMEDLHLNYNWIITTSGIAILVISVLYLNRIIFPKIMKLENELEVLASTDSLTKVFNRSKFSQLIESEIERAERYNHFLSIIMFDIDFFKRINDTYGHLTGDHVLTTLVTLVQEKVRKIDFLIRWGGDEFICILPETNLEGARRLAERIGFSIAQYNFANIGTVTVSLGISQYIKGDTEHTLLKRADEALYKAKMNGGNRIEDKI